MAPEHAREQRQSWTARFALGDDFLGKRSAAGSRTLINSSSSSQFAWEQKIANLPETRCTVILPFRFRSGVRFLFLHFQSQRAEDGRRLIDRGSRTIEGSIKFVRRCIGNRSDRRSRERRCGARHPAAIFLRGNAPAVIREILRHTWLPRRTIYGERNARRSGESGRERG